MGYGFRNNQGGSGGLVDSSAVIHEDTTGLLGGALNDHYHFRGVEHGKLLNLIYDVPTLALNPTAISPISEVGDIIPFNQAISIGIGNVTNVSQNKITIDSVEFNLPKASYNLALVDQKFTTRGTKTLSTAFIRRSDNLGAIVKTVTHQVENRVFAFIRPQTSDLLNVATFSDAQLSALLQATYGVNSYLRADKALGTIRFTPADLSWVYVAYPVAYGQVEMATPTFPNNNTLRSDRIFSYTKNGVITSYRITRMQDTIGGAYDCLIK